MPAGTNRRRTDEEQTKNRRRTTEEQPKNNRREPLLFPLYLPADHRAAACRSSSAPLRPGDAGAASARGAAARRIRQPGQMHGIQRVSVGAFALIQEGVCMVSGGRFLISSSESRSKYFFLSGDINISRGMDLIPNRADNPLAW